MIWQISCLSLTLYENLVCLVPVEVLEVLEVRVLGVGSVWLAADQLLLVLNRHSQIHPPTPALRCVVAQEEVVR